MFFVLKVEPRRPRFPFQQASTFLLSILLIVTFGFLIYFTLLAPPTAQPIKEKKVTEVEAELTVKTDTEEVCIR